MIVSFDHVDEAMDFVRKLPPPIGFATHNHYLQWSRLVGGLGTSAVTKKSTVNSSEQRLIRFRRLHEQLQV